MYSLLIPIWILLAATLGSMIYATYSIATAKVYLPGGQEVRQPSRYTALPAFVSAFVLDCLLTFGLVKTFKKARNGFTSTDSRAEILKRIALQTGSLICLSTLLLIIGEFWILSRESGLKHNIADSETNLLPSNSQSTCYLTHQLTLTLWQIHYQNSTTSVFSAFFWQGVWIDLPKRLKGSWWIFLLSKSLIHPKVNHWIVTVQTGAEVLASASADSESPPARCSDPS